MSKNIINFMKLLAAIYHGRIRPSETLPPMILTGLIRSSDADNYVSLICYIIPFTNHNSIYDNTRAYKFYEI